MRHAPQEEMKREERPAVLFAMQDEEVLSSDKRKTPEKKRKWESDAPRTIRLSLKGKGGERRENLDFEQQTPLKYVMASKVNAPKNGIEKFDINV